MKIKEINGQKYSRESFDTYNLRVKCRFVTKDDTHDMDIYTTEKRMSEIRDAINTMATEKVLDWDIINTSTKEQDDKSSELIDDLLEKLNTK